MKRLSCTTLILAMLLALSACGKKPETPAAATSAQNTAAAVTAAPDDAGAGNSGGADAGSTKEAKAPVIPGVLYALNLKDGEKPVVRGVTLSGNRAGTGEENSVNQKPISDSDIRFIYELNEWIYVIPDTDKTSGLWVYIVPHREDPEDFTESFISALSEDTPKTGLEKPEDENWEWGALYVHPDYWSAGDYDLVFVDGLKPVARVYLKLYSENELTVKSDSELEKMMADAKKAAE